jgi:hypothetical protein
MGPSCGCPPNPKSTIQNTPTARLSILTRGPHLRNRPSGPLLRKRLNWKNHQANPTTPVNITTSAHTTHQSKDFRVPPCGVAHWVPPCGCPLEVHQPTYLNTTPNAILIHNWPHYAHQPSPWKSSYGVAAKGPSCGTSPLHSTLSDEVFLRSRPEGSFLRKRFNRPQLPTQPFLKFPSYGVAHWVSPADVLQPTTHEEDFLRSRPKGSFLRIHISQHGPPHNTWFHPTETPNGSLLRMSLIPLFHQRKA